MLTDDEIVAICRLEVDQAQGYDEDVLSQKRSQALEYYHGIMPKAPEGRSQIVSHDVADAVHHTLSNITSMFTSSLLQFKPNHEQDETPAQTESDAVRYQFEREGGFSILNAAAHDALLIGNGWIKVTVDEDIQRDKQRIPRIRPRRPCMRSHSHNQKTKVYLSGKTRSPTP